MGASGSDSVSKNPYETRDELAAAYGIPKQSPAKFKQINVVKDDHTKYIFGLDLSGTLWYSVFGVGEWRQIDGPMQDNF